MCGAAFFFAGRGGVGRGKGKNRLIPIIFNKSACNEKYDITYYDINHKIDHDI